MANDTTRRGDRKDAAADAPGRTGAEARQETAEQRQAQALERHRADPSAQEVQVRREQGGHDRPLGVDHKPHPRPQPAPKDRR